jgi:high-affinity Fe2+/Pb2+ permease
MAFDPEYIWVTPGPLRRVLEITALPAFFFGFFLVAGLGKMGINQVLTFMISMPIFISAWFYLLGWLLDRWRFKRRHRRTATVS